MATRGGNTGKKKPYRPQPKPVEMLPDPAVLEGYDYVVEGSAEMILRMFEAEQRHRHKWEAQALKSYALSNIIGQFLGFFIAMAVFASAAIVGMYGDSAIAGFIWVFGMSIVTMAGLVWSYAKSMGQRPLFGRPTFRRHFRAESDKNKPS